MKKYLFFPAVAMTIFVACNQKEMDFNKESVTEPEIATVQMTFRAATEDAPTRTTLDEGTGAVAWAAGDAVKFVYELNKEPGYITSEALTAEDIDGKVATFTASLPADFAAAFAMTEEDYKTAGGTSLHLYAVSPASVDIDYETASSFYLTVPTVQDGSFASASIALAKWDKTAPSARLEFKNLCGLLKFTVTDAAVRKVVLHSDDYIAGKMDISFTGPAVKNVSSGEKAITVNVPGAGTYYIAVLPTNAEKGIGINNIYVELLDESDNLIGDKASDNSLVIARKQIRSIGTLATGLSDRLYFKSDGTGTGSSWDDAGGVTLLKSTMKSASVVTKNLYLAAGDYVIDDTDVSPSVSDCTFKVYGGYPSGATGKSLAGRNVESNETTIKSTDGKRCIRTKKGKWTFDGISFTSVGYANNATGCAFLILSGTESMLFNNCWFKNSRHAYNNSDSKSATVGSAIRVETAATFTNCKFTGNTNNYGYGGAFTVTNTGTMTASKCLFEDNAAGNAVASRHGGAIYSTGNVRLVECVFKDNIATSSSSGGGAIYCAGGTLFIDRCYFRATKTLATTGGQHIFTKSGTVVGINNSVFTGPFGGGIRMIHQNDAGSLYIVNTTFNSQQSDALIHNSGTCKIVNSIILNSASTGDGMSVRNATGASMNLDYVLYNKYNTASGYQAPTVTNCVSGIKGHVSGKAFPSWYKENSTTMNGNDQTSTTTVKDARGAIHYYVWDGTIPNELGDVFNPTLVQVKTSLGDSDFLTWLGDASLSVDIRGVARNTSAMWPGSYEQASGVASAPAFTVK
ncbi:MAG: hypothetical protein IJQ61_00920 [Bacteroidales bacterium]|nr:hypothetical protein [Bacteroidales bacterium]